MGSPDDPAQPPTPDSDAGILRECDRIALGMQNEVIQRVFAIGLNLQSTTEITLDPLVRRRVDQAIDDLDHVVHIIRDTPPKSRTRPSPHVPGEKRFRRYGPGCSYAPPRPRCGRRTKVPC